MICLNVCLSLCLHCYVCIKVKSIERRRELTATPRPEQHLAEYHREVREHTHTHTYKHTHTNTESWPWLPLCSWLMCCRKCGRRCSVIMKESWSSWGRTTEGRWITSETNTWMRFDSVYITLHYITSEWAVFFLWEATKTNRGVDWLDLAGNVLCNAFTLTNSVNNNNFTQNDKFKQPLGSLFLVVYLKEK